MKYFKKIIFFIPLILGMTGLSGLNQVPFLDALYQCIGMYLFNYFEHPANLYVELARWTAPLVSAAAVILIIKTIKNDLLCIMKSLSKKSAAVYGPEEECQSFMQKMPSAFYAEKKLYPASRIVLLHDEKTNLRFYEEHQKKLKDKQVYLKCTSFSSQTQTREALHFFSSEENAARLYWKEHFLYPLSCARHHQLDIVLIGCKTIGEQILKTGLQYNLFSPDQKITYHVFDDSTLFTSMHTQLHQMHDKVFVYSDPWQKHLDLLKHADRIIVAEQNNQLKLIQDLLFVLNPSELDVFQDSTISSAFLNIPQVHLFDWKTKALHPDLIFHDELNKLAKAVNLRYAHLYSNVEETEEEMEKQWKKISPFLRHSNISAADYHDARCSMLKHDQLQFHELADKQLEILAELEHERWCRFHYLNNWTYGESKDASKRTHPLLIPYQKLSEQEKEKDKENLRVLHHLKA